MTNHGFATSANLVECRECDAMFNLDAQHYYDSLCPECKADADGEETTWPSCIRCREKYDPADAVGVTVPNRSMRGGSERVTVCSDECAEEMRPHRGP